MQRQAEQPHLTAGILAPAQGRSDGVIAGRRGEVDEQVRRRALGPAGHDVFASVQSTDGRRHPALVVLFPQHGEQVRIHGTTMAHVTWHWLAGRGLRKSPPSAVQVGEVIMLATADGSRDRRITMPFSRAQWTGVMLAVTIAALGACGGDGDEDAGAPTTTSTTGGSGDLAESCTRTENGFTVKVRYPGRWHTNDNGVIPACSAFDPTAVVIPNDSEVPLELAITLDVETAPLERLEKPTATTVETTTMLTVAGRPALRQQLVSTGEGLIDRGVRFVRYLVGLGGSTLVAVTYQVHGTDFERNLEAMDAMVMALEIEPAGS